MTVEQPQGGGWSRRVGMALYLKNKGDVWLSPLQRWVLPALGGSAALKYLGFGVTRAILMMTGVALVWECAAVLIGWLEHRSGATHFHYQAAAETDAYKKESLELLRTIAHRVDL
jgi:hypothetical protein